MVFWKSKSTRQARKQEHERLTPGVTPRSLAASLLCMLLAGIYTQYSSVIVAENNQSPEMILPVPAMAVLLLLLLVAGGLYRLFRIRMLSRAELLCVAFSMLFAVPLMTQGFWHRFFGLTTAPLRNANFAILDAYPDNLWPHGPDLLADALNPETALPANGSLTWETIEYEEGVSARIPCLSNAAPEAVSAFSITVPVTGRVDGVALVPGNAHLVSVLARTAGLEVESACFVRVHADDDPAGTLLIQERDADKQTFLHRKGFVRIGAYGVPLADGPCGRLRFVFGLRGRGRVLFADPRLMSVQAIEGAFRGRPILSQAEYDALPPGARPPDAVVKPSNPWSLRGLGYLFAGYIPLREWLRPALVWVSYVLLLCGACFAVNVIMRRKWAESERYPLPLTRIPLALIGAEDPDNGHQGLAAVFHNRYLWAGLAVSLVWGLARGMHAFSPRLPDLNVNLAMQPYFTSPAWGEMFKTNFQLNAFIISIAVFFELNILMSYVIGYWLFRSTYMMGHWAGLDLDAGFPWRYEQTIGAYLGYFAVVILLSWKHVWQVLRAAIRGTPKDPGDALSSRGAVLLLLGCHLGVLAWAKTVGASSASMLIFFCFLVMVGFVAAKFRAECGMAFGYFTPYNAMLFVSACGGMAAFGAEGLLVALLLSGCLTVTVFFLIPGTQFELIEVGRRMRVRPRSLIATCVLGLLGGLFIGGWVFLSNAYAFGGDNIRYQWPFNGLDWFLSGFRTELNITTARWLAGAEGVARHLSNWGQRTMVLWGVLAMGLTLLRQFFAGFWFHPVGFVLGSTHVFDCANWGNLLAAWVIRALVLKIGGASSVRNKLQPFFVGVFLGALITLMIFSVVNSLSVSRGSTLLYRGIP